MCNSPLRPHQVGSSHHPEGSLLRHKVVGQVQFLKVWVLPNELGQAISTSVVDSIVVELENSEICASGTEVEDLPKSGAREMVAAEVDLIVVRVFIVEAFSNIVVLQSLTALRAATVQCPLVPHPAQGPQVARLREPSGENLHSLAST